MRNWHPSPDHQTPGPTPHPPDERATRSVFQLLRDINSAGTAVLMATHDLDLVRRTDYRTIELDHGKIVFDSAETRPAVGERP